MDMLRVTVEAAAANENIPDAELMLERFDMYRKDRDTGNSSVFFSVQLYTKCAVLTLICAVLTTNLCSSKIALCSCAKNDHCKTRLKCTKNAIFGSRGIPNFRGVMLDIDRNII